MNLPILTLVILSHGDDARLETIVESYLDAIADKCIMLIIDSGIPRYLNFLDHKLFNPPHSVRFCISGGIFRSINHALRHVRTQYYMIHGLDDQLIVKAFLRFNSYLVQAQPDLLFASVIKYNKNLSFLRLHQLPHFPTDVFPSHTVGVAIRRNLHQKYGLYSDAYKVISDTAFISYAVSSGCSSDIFTDTISVVGGSGFSKQHEFSAEFELFKLRRSLGCPARFSLYQLLYGLVRRFTRRLIPNS